MENQVSDSRTGIGCLPETPLTQDRYLCFMFVALHAIDLGTQNWRKACGITRRGKVRAESIGAGRTRLGVSGRGEVGQAGEGKDGKPVRQTLHADWSREKFTARSHLGWSTAGTRRHRIECGRALIGTELSAVRHSSRN